MQLAAGLIGGVVLGAAATGYAVPTKYHPVPISAGTGGSFTGLDFGCFYSRSDLNKIEVGPVLECSRVSTSHAGTQCPGRMLTISRYHIVVLNICNGPATQMRFNRSP